MIRLLEAVRDWWNKLPVPVRSAAFGAIAVLVVAVIIALGFTSRPSFLARYESLERSFKTLDSSGHTGLRCDQCHVDSRAGVVRTAARVGDFYRGLVSTPSEPSFMRVGEVASERCLTCHEEDWSDDAKRTSKIPHPAHLRVASETRECVTCHKWTAHEEAYMEKHKAMPFSGVCASFGCHVGFKQPDECKTCHHTLQDAKGEWKEIHPQTVRSSGPNGCLESCHDADQCRLCHTTGKRPEFTGNVAQTGMKAIEREHVKKDWLKKHGSLALKDQQKCMACHVSLGECQDCHQRRPAFHGAKSTWLNKHQKLAKNNEKRCLACHEQPWCDECHKQFKEMR